MVEQTNQKGGVLFSTQSSDPNYNTNKTLLVEASVLDRDQFAGNISIITCPETAIAGDEFSCFVGGRNLQGKYIAQDFNTRNVNGFARSTRNATVLFPYMFSIWNRELSQ